MTKREQYSTAQARRIIASYGSEARMLVQILRDFLEFFGFISDDMVRLLADELNLSRADVHGVVSFYHDFRRERPGEHVIKICQAEACQALGSRALTDHARAVLGVELHETTADDTITLEPAYCLGNCACSPAVMIDDEVYGKVNNALLDQLIGKCGGGAR